MVKKPSERAEKVCAPCHEETVRKYSTSIHYTQHGYQKVLRQRMGKTNWEALAPAYQANCRGCHATCGDCHISRHPSGGGGLIAGHNFVKRPPMRDTCNVCHGGRVGPEFMGLNEGFEPDVHYSKAKMDCNSCHTSTELHGDGKLYTSRYYVPSRPSCLTCHPQQAPGKDTKIEQHKIHGWDLSCFTCHSQGYKTCYNCHIGEGARSRLDFKIGLSTRADQPYTYTVLRHVPVARDTFDKAKKEALPQFDTLPTWKGASPHNILRVTSRNGACNDCHGNEKIFLKESDLLEGDSAANKGMLMPKVPSNLP